MPVHVKRDVRVHGFVNTDHDALYFYPPDMESSGTYVDNAATNTGIAYWSLPDAATNRVKWTAPIPVGWDLTTVRFSFSNLGVATGNFKFQFHYAFRVLGSPSIAPAVTTIDIAPIATGNQNAHTYALPNELVEIPIVDGILGDKPYMDCVLERLGGSVEDTATTACAITSTTMTRVDA